MNSNLKLRIAFGLTLGFILCLGLGLPYLDGKQLAALLAGYAIFSLNFGLIAKIYGISIQVSRSGAPTGGLMRGLLFASLLKFVGLIAALYLLLVFWELSGIFLAFGALVSLFILTSFLVTSYLKSFAAATPPK